MVLFYKKTSILRKKFHVTNGDFVRGLLCNVTEQRKSHSVQYLPLCRFFIFFVKFFLLVLLSKSGPEVLKNWKWIMTKPFHGPPNSVADLGCFSRTWILSSRNPELYFSLPDPDSQH